MDADAGLPKEAECRNAACGMAADAGLPKEAECRNAAFPPLVASSFFSRDYLLGPKMRRGCVGMREIGTQHGPLDVFLCASLGVPGVFFCVYSCGDPLVPRVLLAVEFVVVGGCSVVADGLMTRMSADDSNRDGLLPVDRVTSAFHAASCGRDDFRELLTGKTKKGRYPRTW